MNESITLSKHSNNVPTCKNHNNQKPKTEFYKGKAVFIQKPKTSKDYFSI